MPCPHKSINKRNASTRFTRTRRHNQQRVTLFTLYIFQNGTDSPYLVVSPSNGNIDKLLSKRLAIVANVLIALQVISCGEGGVANP